MATQPNVLMIMADQLTALALGAYGHGVVRTPVLDRLAAAGTLFENAYCNFPLCAPSRFSLLSGKLATRIGAFDNAAEFRASVPTFAHGLRALGYRTCLAGKMHFVGPDQLHGFEERLTTDIYPADFGWTPNWDAPEERIDWWYHNMSSVKDAGIAEATNQLDFDDEVAFHAERWLVDRARETDRKPFFLCASFTHPHDPYAIRREYWDRYDDAEIDLPRVPPLPWEAMDAHSRRLARVSAMDDVSITEEDVRRARHAYYGEISYVDDLVGRLLATLERYGLASNTVVLFTADHGEMLGERGLWYKMHFFEWTLRVPLIVAGPGVAARRVADPVSLLDVLPTFLDLGGGLPDKALLGDGASLAPYLRGASPGPRPVLAEYTAEGALAPILMVRDGSLKLVWSEADPPLLYDLARDPDELENRAGDPAYADGLARLMGILGRSWDAKAIHAAVLESQRARRFTWPALMTGRHTSWDFQPMTDASRQYWRNTQGMDEMEAGKRWPRP